MLNSRDGHDPHVHMTPQVLRVPFLCLPGWIPYSPIKACSSHPPLPLFNQSWLPVCECNQPMRRGREGKPTLLPETYQTGKEEEERTAHQSGWVGNPAREVGEGNIWHHRCKLAWTPTNWHEPRNQGSCTSLLNRHRARLTFPQREFNNQDIRTKKALSHVLSNLASQGSGTHRASFTDNFKFHIGSNRLLFTDNFAFQFRRKMCCIVGKQMKLKDPDKTSVKVSVLVVKGYVLRLSLRMCIYGIVHSF